MKNTKLYIWIALLLFFGSYAQNGSDYYYYYYYKGQKTYLIPDTEKIAVIFTEDFAAKAPRTFEGNAIRPISTLNSASAFSAKTGKAIVDQPYYSEITIREKLDEKQYAKKIIDYHRNKNIRMTSPCFIGENGKFGMTDKFLVKLKSAADEAKLLEMAKKMDAVVLGNWKHNPLCFMLRATKNKGLTTLDFANQFYETGQFAYAKPEFVYRAITTSSDTYFGDQWGIKSTGQYSGVSGIDIKAENAWTISTGTNVNVAVFDSGVQPSHPDLSGNIHSSNGYNAQTNTTPADTLYSAHGTACAGIIGAVQNSIGITGVAPNCKLIPICMDLVIAGVTDTMIANGFYWAADNGADVISCSWGCTASDDIDDAIEYAFEYGRNGKGNVIVFSTGNSNSDTIAYPANSNDKILSVGAINQCGYRISNTAMETPLCGNSVNWSSCYGSQLDVMAPGIKISATDYTGDVPDNVDAMPFVGGDYNPWSESPPNNYGDYDYTKWFSGTSAAAPFVSGVAALILSVNPNLTVLQVNDIIEQTSQKITTGTYTYSTTSGRTNGTWDTQMGYGLVNAYAAVQLAECTTNLTISDDVNGTNHRQATGTITAINSISDTGIAVYHAGTAVVLGEGFHAVANSKLRAYIEGCTDSYVGRGPGKEKITTEASFTETAKRPEKMISLFPNPSDKVVAISSATDLKTVTVYTIDGRSVMKVNIKGKASEIDVSTLQNGIYLCAVESSDGNTYTERFIKN